jgi:hypothetical protein
MLGSLTESTGREKKVYGENIIVFIRRLGNVWWDE